MNRVEYMTRLASMFQDIPVEERQEAMKYYNDYFDEAGEENEEKVAAELILGKRKHLCIRQKKKRKIRTIGGRFS